MSANGNVRLSEMRPGQKGKVVALECAPEIRRRLAEMGVLAGAAVELERVAPLGDPLDVRVRGYRLSLRKSEASGVTVALDG